MHRGVGYLKDEEAKLRGIADVRFIDWVESLFETGMECGAYILVGSPVPKILSVANEEKADLIVAGAHKNTETIEILRRTPIPQERGLEGKMAGECLTRFSTGARIAYVISA